MGIVFSGMFGLGIVLYTKVETEVHLDHILFGDMLGVIARTCCRAGSSPRSSWPSSQSSGGICCSMPSIPSRPRRWAYRCGFSTMAFWPCSP